MNFRQASVHPIHRLMLSVGLLVGVHWRRRLRSDRHLLVGIERGRILRMQRCGLFILGWSICCTVVFRYGIATPNPPEDKQRNTKQPRYPTQNLPTSALGKSFVNACLETYRSNNRSKVIRWFGSCIGGTSGRTGMSSTIMYQFNRKLVSLLRRTFEVLRRQSQSPIVPDQTRLN